MIILKKHYNRTFVFNTESPDIIFQQLTLDDNEISDFVKMKSKDLRLLNQYFHPNHLIFDEYEGSEFYINKYDEAYKKYIRDDLMNTYNTFLFSITYLDRFIKQLRPYGYIKTEDESDLQMKAFKYLNGISEIVDNLKKENKLDSTIKFEKGYYIQDVGTKD